MKVSRQFNVRSETLKWIFLPIIKTGLSWLVPLGVIFFCADIWSYFYVVKSTAAARFWLTKFSEQLPSPQGLEFARDVYYSFSHHFFDFIIEYNLFLLKFVLLVWLIQSLVHVSTLFILHRKGIRKNVADITKAEVGTVYSSITKLGGTVFIVSALMAFVAYIKNLSEMERFKEAIPYILWGGVGPFLLISSVVLIRTYRKFRSRGKLVRRYILITGASQALTLVLLTNLLVLFVNSLPATTISNFSTLKEEMATYAERRSSQELSGTDKTIAVANVRRTFQTVSDSVVSVKELQQVIGRAEWHVTRFMILIWYVVFATRFVALRYGRPYMSFFIGGLILAVPSILLDSFFNSLFVKYTGAHDVKFLIALSGVAVGYYVALLLEPVTGEKDPLGRNDDAAEV